MTVTPFTGKLSSPTSGYTIPGGQYAIGTFFADNMGQANSTFATVVLNGSMVIVPFFFGYKTLPLTFNAGDVLTQAAETFYPPITVNGYLATTSTRKTPFTAGLGSGLTYTVPAGVLRALFSFWMYNYQTFGGSGQPQYYLQINGVNVVTYNGSAFQPMASGPYMGPFTAQAGDVISFAAGATSTFTDGAGRNYTIYPGWINGFLYTS